MPDEMPGAYTRSKRSGRATGFAGRNIRIPGDRCQSDDADRSSWRKVHAADGDGAAFY